MNRPAERPGIEPRRWGWMAVAFGLFGVAAYLSIAARLLPMPVLRILFISLGPVVAIAIYAFGSFLATERDSAALRIGVMLHVVAAAFMSAMALIQNVNLVTTRTRLNETSDAQARAMIEAVFRGIDNVQLGLDVGFDLWLVAGAVFLALAVLAHPWYKRWIGWVGIAAAVVVLFTNLWTFPVPPAQAGWFDAGPVLAVWYGLVIALGARRVRLRRP